MEGYNKLSEQVAAALNFNMCKNLKHHNVSHEETNVKKMFELPLEADNDDTMKIWSNMRRIGRDNSQSTFFLTEIEESTRNDSLLLFGRYKGHSCCVRLEEIPRIVYFVINDADDEHDLIRLQQKINQLCDIYSMQNCVFSRLYTECASSAGLGMLNTIQMTYPSLYGQEPLRWRTSALSPFSVRILPSAQSRWEIVWQQLHVDSPPLYLNLNANTDQWSDVIADGDRITSCSIEMKCNMATTRMTTAWCDVSYGEMARLSLMSLTVVMEGERISYVVCMFMLDCDVAKAVDQNDYSLTDHFCYVVPSGCKMSKPQTEMKSKLYMNPYVVDNEHALLRILRERIQTLDPDVLVVGNAAQLQVLCSKMEKYGIEQPHLGRLRPGDYQQQLLSRAGLAHGRMLCDMTYIRGLLSGKAQGGVTEQLQALSLRTAPSDIPVTVEKAHLVTLDLLLDLLRTRALSVSHEVATLAHLPTIMMTLTPNMAARVSHTLLHRSLIKAQRIICKDKMYVARSQAEVAVSEVLQGGLVLTPRVGLYTNYVLEMDFAALYASVVLEYGVCYSAQAAILPGIMKELLEGRRKEGNLPATGKILKQIANAIIGFLWLESQWGSPILAKRIAAFGRKCLTSAIDVIEKEMKLNVIYGDTDSVFVDSGTDDYDMAMHLANDIHARVNASYKWVRLELCAVYKRFCAIGKKRYAGVQVDAGNHERLVLRGIKRSDRSKLAEDVSEQVVSRLMSGGSADDISNFLSSLTRHLRSDPNLTPLDSRLTMRRRVMRPMSTYHGAAGQQPQVQAANEYNAKFNKQHHFDEGDLVPYVAVLCKQNARFLTPFHAHLDECGADVDYYLHQIANALDPIIGAVFDSKHTSALISSALEVKVQTEAAQTHSFGRSLMRTIPIVDFYFDRYIESDEYIIISNNKWTKIQPMRFTCACGALFSIPNNNHHLARCDGAKEGNYHSSNSSICQRTIGENKTTLFSNIHSTISDLKKRYSRNWICLNSNCIFEGKIHVGITTNRSSPCPTCHHLMNRAFGVDSLVQYVKTWQRSVNPDDITSYDYKLLDCLRYIRVVLQKTLDEYNEEKQLKLPTFIKLNSN